MQTNTCLVQMNQVHQKTNTIVLEKISAFNRCWIERRMVVLKHTSFRKKQKASSSRVQKGDKHMRLTTIILYTRDEAYAQYFTNFIRLEEKDKRYIFKVYTNKDQLIESTRNQRFNIFLTDDKNTGIEESIFDEIIFLSEQEGLADEKTLYKYRPIKTLISQILSLFYEVSGTPTSRLFETDQDKVIAFYSGSGGEGKTITSLCLARHLSQIGKRVFYLNLEAFHTVDIFFKENKQSSIEIFYYLKNNLDKLIAKIEGLKTIDPNTNIEYFSYPIVPDEINQLTSREAEQLVQALRTTNNYDYIIVDMDSVVDEKNEAILSVADEIFWILDPVEQSMQRSSFYIENYYSQLMQIKKSNIHFILNKADDASQRVLNKYHFSIIEKIEWQPNWKQLDESECVLADTVVGLKLSEVINVNTEPLTEVNALYEDTN